MDRIGAMAYLNYVNIWLEIDQQILKQIKKKVQYVLWPKMMSVAIIDKIKGFKCRMGK